MDEPNGMSKRRWKKKEEWRETLGIQWSRADFVHPVDVTRGRDEPEYLQRSYKVSR